MKPYHILPFLIFFQAMTASSALINEEQVGSQEQNLIGTVIYNTENGVHCVHSQNSDLGGDLEPCEGQELDYATNANPEANTQTAALGVAAVYAGACVAGVIGQVAANQLESPRDESAAVLYHAIGSIVSAVGSGIYFLNTVSGAVISGAGGVLGAGAGATFMACGLGTHYFLNIYENPEQD